MYAEFENKKFNKWNLPENSCMIFCLYFERKWESQNRCELISFTQTQWYGKERTKIKINQGKFSVGK